MPEALNGLPVRGYVPQVQANIDSVNENKMHEEMLLRKLDLMRANVDIDQRWLAMGRTHIEQGYMFINRAIFQPERVALPGDGKE